MEHRSGRKFGGEHTTFTEMSSEIADMLIKLPEVEKISSGFIEAGIGSGRGRRSVKIVDDPGYILLKVKQSGSAQEVRIFTKDRQKVKLLLARYLRDRDIDIAFQDRNR